MRIQGDITPITYLKRWINTFSVPRLLMILYVSFLIILFSGAPPINSIEKGDNLWEGLGLFKSLVFLPLLIRIILLYES